ncbi:putative permease [Corynebacterium renale]|uniref:CBU-0592-like domain-containing protein n=1 Tax=Corynebacterium renale TaxID=1724 RepID=A0A2A9DSN3_9CORY|nr:transporter [Corynebacterium renale]PFG28929.1 hypothetical protein ATK06_2058 [Corynebacterium renale]SQG64477.1 putative permease [Corynebacterium renale]SQI25552.1 putative permease [Corynebacterium renale]STC95376.1 putative permease [Corynebacterium renale]
MNPHVVLLAQEAEEAVETLPFQTEISLAASVVLLLAFALLNLGKLTPEHYTYQWANAIGAAFLTYTCIKPFNVGVFITEALWTLIGLYGVYKIYRTRKKRQAQGLDPMPQAPNA